MRLGLLGLGRIGASHADTLTSLPAVDSLVVSDPVTALADEIAGRLGAQVAGTPEALLASGVDGVVIAAPGRQRLIRPRRRKIMSPRPAGSSVTAACTTSTPSAG